MIPKVVFLEWWEGPHLARGGQPHRHSVWKPRFPWLRTPRVTFATSTLLTRSSVIGVAFTALKKWSWPLRMRS